jgi:hypothetical protein
MINPNAVHRVKMKIVEIRKTFETTYLVFDYKGQKFESCLLYEKTTKNFKKLKVGLTVLCYVSFSIIGDHYYVSRLGKIYN